LQVPHARRDIPAAAGARLPIFAAVSGGSAASFRRANEIGIGYGARRR